jgi:hypothetical protein
VLSTHRNLAHTGVERPFQQKAIRSISGTLIKPAPMPTKPHPVFPPLPWSRGED